MIGSQNGADRISKNGKIANMQHFLREMLEFYGLGPYLLYHSRNTLEEVVGVAVKFDFFMFLLQIMAFTNRVPSGTHWKKQQ